MPLQMKMSADGPAFSPARDLRYCYPQLVELVCKRFSTNGWPELLAYAEARGTNFEELCRANEAYIQFLNTCCDDPKEGLYDVLKRVGWFDVPVEAQIAYQAMLGTVLTGQLMWAFRDTTVLGDQPSGMEHLNELMTAALATQVPPRNLEPVREPAAQLG